MLYKPSPCISIFFSLNLSHPYQSNKKITPMKKYISKILAIASVFIIAIGFTSCSSYTVGAYPERVVVARPAPPYYVRPVAPGPNFVWVEGEWIWRGGRYEYVQGYWTRPVYGRYYVPGHWKYTRGGYFWIPGHWKRGY
jgi:hypothetical protein